MEQDNLNDLIVLLKRNAIKKSWLDRPNFSAFNDSGGNYDDAFWGGMDAGEIALSRGLLKQFFPNEELK